MDLVYIFHFREDDKDEALNRFRCSLNSVSKKDFNICVLNSSDFCIRGFLDQDVRYAHVPKDFGEKLYNRSFMINECVKRLVTSEYFNIADIDVLFPKTFLSTVEKIIANEVEPCRIVYFNNNMGVGNYETYDECKKDFPLNKDHLRSKRGRAGGLGVVHTESFLKINGFEERYIGYGPEDQDFNLRISKINKYIELDDERINTYHLWHNNYTPKKNHRENLRIFQYIKEYIHKHDLKIVKSGSIEIPPILYHQENESIVEMEF